MPRITIECKICNNKKEMISSVAKKLLRVKFGCCSLECFKQTSDFKERRRISDQKRIKKIRETGDFSKNGKKSVTTRASSLLIKHGYNIEQMLEEQILELWKEKFNALTQHGEKIKAGRKNKYPLNEQQKKSRC